MNFIKELYKRTSIKTKGVLYVVVLILFIYISVSIIVLSMSRKNLLMQRKQFHLSVAEKLSLNASDAIITRDYGFLLEQIRQLKSTGQIKNAKVVDRRGIIIASDEISLIGSPDNTLSALLKQKSKRSLNSTDSTISLPITIGDDILGALSLTFNTEAEDRAFREDLKKTILQLVYLSFVILAIGIGGAYVVSLLITRPIITLSKEIESFEQEIDYSTNIPETVNTYRDEVEQLRQSFYHMQETLRRYLSEYRRLSEEKEKMTCLAAIGEMSAQIAHELRNSLHAIRGALSGIEQAVNREELDEYVEIIKDEAYEMLSMADEFFRFAKLPVPAPKPTSILEILDKVSDLLEPDLEESGVSIEYRKDNSIPPLMVDPALMKQVFMNLFINSIQAMKDGGKIMVWFDVIDRGVEIHIEDTGPGIPKELASRVFQPFFTTKVEGSGLGLPTVYKIVLAHHGEIRLVESSKGAHFIIILPVAEANKGNLQTGGA
ncbi:MAG: sensor histidine kinase [Nitrospirae bacterium]|nr:MAG: sensor histidine kinase [Nitrospirota bacterium]